MKMLQAFHDPSINFHRGRKVEMFKAPEMRLHFDSDV